MMERLRSLKWREKADGTKSALHTTIEARYRRRRGKNARGQTDLLNDKREIGLTGGQEWPSVPFLVPR